MIALKSLSPLAFSVLNCFPDGPNFETSDASGMVFLSNCHIPLDDTVTFRQRLSAEALARGKRRYGIEVEILEKRFDWMSLELHVPREILADHNSALLSVRARSAKPTRMAIGCGGLLNRDRGFECFVMHNFSTSQNYKTVGKEMPLAAFPLDEIENDKLVMAIYFNFADATTFTISDFRLDLI